MLNLNRYKYADDEPKVGVPAAYQSYGASVIPLMFKNGGHPVYSGEFVTRLLREDSDEAY